jgi:hypothetical protein
MLNNDCTNLYKKFAFQNNFIIIYGKFFQIVKFKKCNFTNSNPHSN